MDLLVFVSESMSHNSTHVSQVYKYSLIIIRVLELVLIKIRFFFKFTASIFIGQNIEDACCGDESRNRSGESRMHEESVLFGDGNRM